MTTQPSARADYVSQLEDARTEIARLQSRHVKMVWVRTCLFFLAAICLFFGYGQLAFRLPLLTLGWLSVAAFFVAIVSHEHLRLTRLRFESQANLMERLLARLDRNWDKLPDTKLLPELSELTVADDLDLAGNASLLSLLSLAGTPPGKRTVQRWLSENATWEAVRSRQQAVRALVPHRDLRMSIIKTVQANSDGTEDVYGLPKWAQSPDWLPQHRIAWALSYLGPACVGAGMIAVMTAIFTQDKTALPNIALGLLGAGLVLNVLVTVFWGSWIHDIFQQVTGTHQATFQFANVFDSFEKLPSDGGLLDDIRRTAVEDLDCARAGFGKLLWIVRLANFQRDVLMYLVYLALQLLFLWDFRVLKLLEGWKHRFGASVAGWFDSLGVCEAVISSATLADENPQWCFPQPQLDKAIRLKAIRLGHPLLSDTARVENDLIMTTDQPLLLVTGSNMAGKSTFLRALGLNLLLARAGSPVCATDFSAPLFDLATSIRVRDSLRDGVSFFMAELKRLKEVVDQAQSQSDNTENPVLFLLDEILQGTNSRERQLAVTTVIERLISYGAAGLLSTHDLDLATVDAIAQVSQIVHFHEYFETVEGREIMRFDYKMRPGSTPTTNALKLLKLVGLE